MSVRFFTVSIIEGTELILTASNIRNSIHEADLIVTGEGKIDLQSCRGKTICAIPSMARQNNIPVIAFCGKLELLQSQYKDLGLQLASEITDGSISEEQSMRDAYELLSKKAASTIPSILKMLRHK